MLLPLSRGLFQIDYQYWEKTIHSLAGGLREKGFEITVYPEHDPDMPGPGALGACVRVFDFFEKARDFDLVHGYFDPLLAARAAMAEAPAAIITLDGPISAQDLAVLKKYRDRVFCVSPFEGPPDNELDCSLTVRPGLDVDQYRFQDRPGDYIVCFARMMGNKEIVEAEEITRRAGKRLVITGNSASAKRIGRIMPLLHGRSIEFAGLSNPEDEAGLIAGAYALLYLGRRVPFVGSLLVSMASGTPIVAVGTNNAISEVVIPGITGFIAGSQEEAAEALSRVGGLDRRACRVAVKDRFNMDLMVDGYSRLYSAILDKTDREDRRPWGYYEVLADEDHYKVKRIVVYPGKRLSLQRHLYRAEHWHILSGTAIARSGDREVLLKSGESVDIPEKVLHRLHNPGTENLMIIEVQRGSYCGEDDIERFDDDYGRA
jgi:mannose-6-phosphate isomerase-like protein (cupin superfamily)